MSKFSFYDYGEDGMHWVEDTYYYDLPKEWQDYKNGDCYYVATFIIEDDKIELDIFSQNLDYAPILEEKARELSKYCEISCDYDQDKEFCNYFISKGWVVQKLNPDTAELFLS
jgi:hypothetical protein